MDRIESLKQLKHNPQHGRVRLTEEEGYAIIRALRLGCTHKEVADVLGKSKQNIAQVIGTWAIHHLKLPE